MVQVSIVSSVYNRAEHTVASVRSMLSQDHGDFEVVVIDDGSKDDTLARLATITDPRLKVISQENTGFTIAIDRAVRAASGRYVAIVDGGDLCKPDRIAKQAAYLDAHPDVGIVGSWVELMEERTGRTTVVKLDVSSDPARTLMTKSVYWHSEVMFRADLYRKVGGYRPVFYYSQDNDLWLRMSEHSRLACIPEVLHTIIKFSGGISTTPEKFALARAYRDFAVFCAKERRAGRPDPVDRFGRNALLLRPRSSRLANRLALDGIKNVLRRETESGRWILDFAVREKPTPLALLMYLVGHVPGIHVLRDFGLAIRQFGRGFDGIRPV